MIYRISKEAALDLEKIWLYTSKKWSFEQADRYINLILDEFEYLSQNPSSGRSYNAIKRGYFCSKIKSHLIFYKFSPPSDAIEIIRVLHQRMDILSRLDD